jgi:hypothetical protein
VPRFSSEIKIPPPPIKIATNPSGQIFFLIIAPTSSVFLVESEKEKNKNAEKNKRKGSPAWV